MNDIIFRTILLKGEAGNNIESIEKTNTQGLVDTYTVTLTDGTTTTFEVTNGKSIVSIEKTSSVGYVDTYTITYNDGSTDTFDITLATISVDDALSDSSTNPVQNKAITQALEDAQQTLEKQIVPSANIEPTSTASQAYTAGSYLVLDGVLRKVTSAIAQGDTISDSNTSVTNAGLELTQINSDLSDKLEPAYMDSISSWTTLYNRIKARNPNGGVVCGYCASTVSTDGGRLSYFGYIYPNSDGNYGDLMVVGIGGLIIISCVNGTITATRLPS